MPPNMTAEVWIFESAAATVTHTHETLLSQEEGCAVCQVGPGTHRFSG
ncbi:hypothetical protein [Streptomyces sp. NPDC056683]